MDTFDLHVGTIVNTHGIKGDVKLMYYADSTDFFDNITKVCLKPKNLSFEVTSYRVHKGAVLLKLKGVDDIDTAQTLVRQEVYVEREEAPLPEGRYYIVDLIGLLVVTDTGDTVGKLCDVFRTGANDVFTVKTDDGREVLIPVIDEVVTDISIDKGVVTIHPMKGLLSDED